MLKLYAYAMIAGTCAVIFETYLRSTQHPFWIAYLIAVPLNLIVLYCLYNLFTQVEYLLLGAVMFSLATYSGRIVSSLFWLGEDPPLKVYVAFGLVALAQVVRFLPIWSD